MAAGCGCVQTAGSRPNGARTWVKSWYVNFSSGDKIQPADGWLDCRSWRTVWVFVEFEGTGGSSLTVTLETVPALNVDATGAWQTVTSATTTMSTSPAVLQGKFSLAVPPMGLLRLKLTAAAQVTGSLRVSVLLKGAT